MITEFEIRLDDGSDTPHVRLEWQDGISEGVVEIQMNPAVAVALDQIELPLQERDLRAPPEHDPAKPTKPVTFKPMTLLVDRRTWQLSQDGTSILVLACTPKITGWTAFVAFRYNRWPEWARVVAVIAVALAVLTPLLLLYGVVQTGGWIGLLGWLGANLGYAISGCGLVAMAAFSYHSTERRYLKAALWAVPVFGLIVLYEIWTASDLVIAPEADWPEDYVAYGNELLGWAETSILVLSPWLGILVMLSKIADFSAMQTVLEFLNKRSKKGTP